MSCERCSMKKRAASRRSASSRSSSVTKSPRRLDIDARSPRSTRLTNCMMMSSIASAGAPSAAKRGVHARDVAVVVGAPDVDQPVEAALALVEVVGDVRRQVRGLAGRALEHAVLVVAVRGRAQPQRALGAVALAALRRAARRHAAPPTGRPSAASPPRTRRRSRRRSRCIDARIRSSRSCTPRSATTSTSSVAASGIRSASSSDVVALVAALGHRLAARARLDRLAEAAHLAAHVVDVELARDVVAAELAAAAPASRRTPRGGRRRRSSGRSGWPRRTRRSPARRGRRRRRRTRRRRRARAPSASTYQASDRKRLRKPGPAISTRSSDAPRRCSSSSASRPATSRGGTPARGASSIAAFVA